MPLSCLLAHRLAEHSCSAQSAVSITRVRHSPGVFRTCRTWAVSSAQVSGRLNRRASRKAVEPSVSINSGSGKAAARVLLPMPSGP